MKLNTPMLGTSLWPRLRSQLLSFWGIAVLVIVAVTVSSAYWNYQTRIVAASQTAIDKAIDAQLHKRVKAVEYYITRQQKKLAPLRFDPLLLEPLTNQVVSAETQKRVTEVFPKALMIRLVDLEGRDYLLFSSADIEPPKLGFTELDLVHRTENQQKVAPEAKKSGKTWQLLLTTAISQDDEAPVAATLLVTLPGTELIRTLSKVDPQMGGSQLQRLSKNPVTLFAAGSGDTKPVVTQTIKNSVWQIRFQPSYALIEQNTKSPLLLFALHGAAALIALLILFIFRYFFSPAIKARRQATKNSKENTTAEESATTPSHFDEDEEAALHNLLLAAEDESVLGLGNSSRSGNGQKNTASLLPAEIFRAYDIRGIAYEQISPVVARQVGKAIATETLMAGDTALFVARDGRLHSEELTQALTEGILSTGCHVIDLGRVPTPLLYFATCELSQSNSGIMVTASHNPANYNGFKMVIKGKTLFDEAVQNIRTRIEAQDFYRGEGNRSTLDIIGPYIQRIVTDLAIAGRLKVVVDAGNGVTGEIAPILFEELGCDVECLYCDVDGNFPNHPPDPTIADNLADLIQRVQRSQADLGIALDGDGDRVIVVTPTGQIIWPDRMLMLFAKDILTRHDGASVIFDVKSTRVLNDLVSDYGGQPIMWKSGHSHMKNKMLETGALIGGELSGHIFIKDRWYGFDDGMYAAARLLEIMTMRDQSLEELFQTFQTMPSTPEILIPVDESRKFKIIKRLALEANFEDGKIITIDGLRVDFAKGWGLVRASNTSAALTVRFEAKNEQLLDQLKILFRRELLKVDNTLSIPF